MLLESSTASGGLNCVTNYYLNLHTHKYHYIIMTRL